MKAVEVHNLSFRYDDGTLALDDVSFDLEAGETVAVLGPNGSGKTTFVLHLNGVLRGEGSVAICGIPLANETLGAIRSKVGMVFQDSDEQLFMPTVLEDVAFGPMNQGLDQGEALARAKSSLVTVGLGDALNKAPYHLSAGEKRRAALAGVLVMQPEILVLDEPTTFLDPPAQSNLCNLLSNLPQAKLIVTHNTRFAAGLAKRAAFFEKGKLVADGLLDEIVQRYEWSYSPRAGDVADFRYSAQRRF